VPDSENTLTVIVQDNKPGKSFANGKLAGQWRGKGERSGNVF